MKHYIITGASRGLGAALARELLSPDASVFCVSRSLNEELITESNEAGVELHWIQADLSETLSIEAFMDTITERIDVEGSELIVLVNNAAVLTPLGLVGSAGDDELQNAVQVNLIAPMILTHSFMRHFASVACPRVVINVSSGAGRTPMPGLSTYSTTKAAINMFTETAAAEYPEATSGCRFYAVSPGTVDTQMQDALRAAGPSLLPNHNTYVEWKESGSLIKPDEAARAVLSLVARTDIPSGSFVHRRDLEE